MSKNTDRVKISGRYGNSIFHVDLSFNLYLLL